jgi:putative flippase GtrA
MGKLAVFCNKVWEKLFNKEVITYIIFGVMTTVISIIVFNICVDSGYDEIISNTISTVIAVLFAFVTNKIWVFNSRDYSVKTLASELSKFSLGRLFTFLVETVLLVILVRLLSIPSKISKYITQVVVIVLNYLVSKLAVFRK